MAESKIHPIRINLLPVKRNSISRKTKDGVRLGSAIIAAIVVCGLGVFWAFTMSNERSVAQTSRSFQNVHAPVVVVSGDSEKCLFGREAKVLSYQEARSSDMAMVTLQYSGSRQPKMPHFIFSSAIEPTQLGRLATEKGEVCFQLAKDGSGFVNLLPVKK